MRRVCPGLFPRPRSEVRPSELAHARQQLRELGESTDLYDVEEVPIESWVVEQLAGEAVGHPIDVLLHDRKTKFGGRSYHVIPNLEKRGKIVLRRGQPFAGLWFTLVYEIYNMRHSSTRGLATVRAAVLGEMTVSQASRELGESEMAAMRDTAAFLAERWDPWADANGYSTAARLLGDVPNYRTLEEAGESSATLPGYPDSVFGPQIERTIEACRPAK